MYVKYLLFACLINGIFGLKVNGDIGSELWRTYLVYDQLPVNVSQANKFSWVPYISTCDPNLGIAYTYYWNSPGEYYPLVLYFTAGGQIAGLGLVHYGAPAPGLNEYWVPQKDGTYFMSATFRSTQNICNPKYQYEQILGDQVVINQGSLNLHIPLTEELSSKLNYTSGSCLSTMGRHWIYDMKTAPVMSWKVSNLQPIVPMYMNGSISAFFFTTSTIQYGTPIGTWEFPLYFQLMCENFCTSDCDFDSSQFSTLHFFLDDYEDNTCENQCP